MKICFFLSRSKGDSSFPLTYSNIFVAFDGLESIYSVDTVALYCTTGDVCSVLCICSVVERQHWFVNRCSKGWTTLCKWCHTKVIRGSFRPYWADHRGYLKEMENKKKGFLTGWEGITVSLCTAAVASSIRNPGEFNNSKKRRRRKKTFKTK